MDAEHLIAQVRAGMQVVCADGKQLGKVRQIHPPETEAYLEVPYRGALWSLMAPKGRFLPASTVVEVVGNRVHLNMDAQTARGCTVRPRWISQDIEDPTYWAGIGGSGGGG